MRTKETSRTTDAATQQPPHLPNSSRLVKTFTKSANHQPHAILKPVLSFSAGHPPRPGGCCRCQFPFILPWQQLLPPLRPGRFRRRRLWRRQLWRRRLWRLRLWLWPRPRFRWFWRWFRRWHRRRRTVRMLWILLLNDHKGLNNPRDFQSAQSVKIALLFC